MRKILFVLLVLMAHAGFAQYLELHGKVNYFDLKPGGKIYYTEPGKKFDPKVFIQYDKDFNYTFKMRIKDIREKNIQALVFTMDTGAGSGDEYACAWRINVGTIINDPAFKEMKSIKLNSELPLDYNCSSTIAYGATEQGLQDWIGLYTMKHADTTFIVSLRDMLFRVEANLSKRDAQFMDKYRGIWRFNADTKTLNIDFGYRMNESFGIIVYKPEAYIFDAPNGSDAREFKGRGITLSRQ